MMPTVQQLRYLVALAETGNFTRASERLHVTQPTLSTQIRDLERKLDLRLIEKTRPTVIFTRAGQAVLAEARAIIAGIGRIRALAAPGRSLFDGTINLGTIHSVGAYLLHVIVPALRQRYPRLGIYVREETRDHLLDGLRRGVHDVIIVPSKDDEENLSIVPLYLEPLQLVVPADHRLAEKERILAHDLEGLKVLALEKGHSIHGQVLDLCARYGADLDYDFASTSLDTLRQMVAMGMGVTFLPSLYVRSEARRELLVAARDVEDDPINRRIVAMLRPTSSHAGEFARLFEEMLDILEGTCPEVITIRPPGP